MFEITAKYLFEIHEILRDQNCLGGRVCVKDEGNLNLFSQQSTKLWRNMQPIKPGTPGRALSL